jgi:quinoprotein glucose dehydrogenase
MTRIFSAAILGVLVTAGFGSLLAEQAKSQWDGVYTEQQAKRGDGIYQEKCASCHGPDMTGGEMAPGLAGAEFATNWNDLSVGDLFERIRISMPQNNPGSLSRAENADVVSYILQKGGYPKGEAELPTQADALNQIKFLATKPE